MQAGGGPPSPPNPPDPPDPAGPSAPPVTPPPNRGPKPKPLTMSKSHSILQFMSEKVPENVCIIQKITGAWGRYQLFVCILMFLNKFPMAYHQMAIIFLGPKVKYICPDTNRSTCPCANPQYDTSIFKRTIIMEWHLICEKRWLASFAQTVFQFGVLVGSVIFGMASDSFGRKYPLLVAVVVQVTAGVAAAYVPDYWSFTFLRFLVGASVGGTIVVGFVIVMEFVGVQYRDILSAVYQVPFNLGHMMLPLFGYFFRDFQQFQSVISFPTIILLSYICLCPETPRWLIAVKRTEQAITILEKVAKINHRPVDNIRVDVEAYQAQIAKVQVKKGNVLDLFRRPNLRKHIIVMSLNWLSCSYCFYGVSQYMGQLSGNVFSNVAISATVTLCGTLLSIPLMRSFGRKTIVIACNFACAICLLTLAVIPESIASVVCASIGSVTSFIIFVVVYLYCSELFPTVVRSAAVGFSSMMARVGSMVAPFVISTRPYGRWIPPLALAIAPLIAGCLAFLMPETKGCDLMTTIEEGENFGKKK